jgi:CelD/BcsL family acetyltransferase involved in cellulose biosynthesis
MDIHVFDDLNHLDGLCQPWQFVYAADPHATVFLSWPFMHGWLRTTPHDWAVIAARPHAQAPWCAFWPISFRGKSHSYRLDQVCELRMAGDPVADYTGVICDPAHADRALLAMAEFAMENLAWDRLVLRDVSDPRIIRLAEQLRDSPLRVQTGRGQCCPYVPLPATWDEYINQRLGREMRRSLRRGLREVHKSFHTTTMDQADPDPAIDTLLQLAARRHGKSIDPSVLHARDLVRSCAAAGLANIMVMWDGRTPIAAQGWFVDSTNQNGSNAPLKAMRIYMAGFDDRYASISPGRMLDALCIRSAIEQGMKEVDFLRGDEPYKFRFGALRRYNTVITAQRDAMPTRARLALHRWRDRLGI